MESSAPPGSEFLSGEEPEAFSHHRQRRAHLGPHPQGEVSTKAGTDHHGRAIHAACLRIGPPPGPGRRREDRRRHARDAARRNGARRILRNDTPHRTPRVTPAVSNTFELARSSRSRARAARVGPSRSPRSASMIARQVDARRRSAGWPTPTGPEDPARRPPVVRCPDRRCSCEHFSGGLRLPGPSTRFRLR